MSYIEIRNLYKIFGPKPKEALADVKAGLAKDAIMQKSAHTVGLDDVSLTVERGETFVVMGLSGSGKSTLIRCLNRLIEPTAGEILIDGEDVLSMQNKQVQTLRRHRMSMVFQRFALFPHRNVLQNVAYGLKVQGVPKAEREEKAQHWIEVVGLKGYERSRPRQLSGGMQQRVGLARALCTDPEVLLMDEAFSALDPLIRREMQDELIKLQRKLNKTILFITHDLDEALRLGDRVAILKDGQVVQVGTPLDILDQPADDYVEDFVRDVNRAKVLSAKAAMTPAFKARLDEPLREVAARLESCDATAIYVVDAENRYQGVIHKHYLLDAIKKGETELRKTLCQDAPTTDEDTVLEPLLGVAADSPLPIAVLTEDDHLKGVLTRSAILAALANQLSDQDLTTSADAPHTTVIENSS